LTAGDGGIEYTIEGALAMIEGGVDLLEIGLPFSDPVADGPVIQRSHERALAQGTSPLHLLEVGRRLREYTDIPLVLFTYFNPLLQKGDLFLVELKEAGFDAALVVDLPPPLPGSGSTPFFRSLESAGLLPILLAASSTSDERLEQLGRIPQGFLYYVSQKGTTGVRHQMADDFADQMVRIRKQVRQPIVAGFGIANRESAKAALAHADGFVVGSAFAKLVEQKAAPEKLMELAREIDPR
jgi:tryptophan synthase alpha chain